MNEEIDLFIELERLVADEDYAGAQNLCRVALATGGSVQTWETQLGYVSFLNERDANSHYSIAPKAFAKLVAMFPQDTNARFWLAYIEDVVFSKLDQARHHLHYVLALNPEHPYANLVLAGISEPDASTRSLRRTLTQQPANFRALGQLAKGLMSLNQQAEALKTLERMLTDEPYVEHNYGIMNTYMNDVLTGATSAPVLREEARAQILAKQ